MAYKLITDNGILIKQGDQYIKMTEESGGSPTYPTDGLLARYLFNDNLNDEINGYNLLNAIGPNVYSSDAKEGKSIQFRADSGAYIPGSTLGGIFNSEQYSVSSWVNILDFSSYSYILNYSATSDSNPYTRFLVRSQNPNIIYVQIGSSTTTWVSGQLEDNYLDVNTWYHLVITFNKPTFNLYINNSLQFSINYNYTLSSHANTFGIGYRLQNSTYRSNINMDLMYIYNKALSDTEISQLYNNGNGI